MPSIKFIDDKLQQVIVHGDSGSVMELAVENNISGIDGNCGGVGSCATCHVHVQEAFMAMLKEKDSFEEDMLEFQDFVSDYSRLSCQLEVAEMPDGIVLTVAT